jgi:iron complex outermembrane receptor protein
VPQPPGAPFPGANVNFDPTTHQGIILQSHYDIGQKINLSGNYTFTDATFDSGVFAGNEISGVARHSARLNINYAINSLVATNLGAVYVGSHYLDGDNANAQSKVPGYTVLDLNLAYAYMDWRVNLKVNNITNRKYFENANSFGSIYPSPERNFLLTAGWDFR